MASCELAIECRRSQRRYFIGDSIDGAVQVRIASRCICNKLVVRLQLKTSGSGRVDEKIVESEVLAQEETWEAGEEREYEFSFTAPESPISYEGELFNVSWSVEAHADLAWAADAHARDTVELILPPEPRLELRRATPEEALPPRIINPPLTGPRLKNRFPVVGLLWSLLLIIAGAIVFAANIEALPSQAIDWLSPGLLIFLAIPTLLFFFGGRGAIRATKRILSTLAFRKLDLELIPDRTPGVIRAIVETPKLENEDLSSLEGALQVIEWSSTSRGGSRGNSRDKDIVTQTATFTPIPGEPRRHEATFQIPRQTPPTFSTGNNAIIWQMTLYARQEKGQDWGNYFQFFARYIPRRERNPYR